METPGPQFDNFSPGKFYLKGTEIFERRPKSGIQIIQNLSSYRYEPVFSEKGYLESANLYPIEVAGFQIGLSLCTGDAKH